jgi:uncharacterized metal-binding protein
VKPATLALLESITTMLRKATEEVQRETRELVGSNDHINLIRHFAKVRNASELIKASRESLDEIEKQLSREYVPDSLRSRNIRTITVDDVGRVSLSVRWSCSMLDKQLGFQWLRETGNESLIQETVNAQTLAAFAKDLNVTKGIELPQDIFNTSQMTVTSITKV